jgi:AraC-like DNA-binding protein
MQVRHIQELLRTTDLPLEEIAKKSGFAYVESMHRIFKRMAGMTPSQYRKRIRNPE